jgi:hypothetical protein
MFNAALRRGLIMTSTMHFENVPGGVALQDAFWCVAGDIIINPDAKKIIYWYHCWRSVEDYEAGFPAIPGAQRVYQVDGVAYDLAIQTGTKNPQGTPIGYELLGMFNDHAIATKDVPVEGGEAVSFFEYAERAA